MINNMAWVAAEANNSGITQLGKINNIYNFVLFCLYFLLALFIGLQLGRIAYYRHKILSFQVGFLAQCFFSALLRSIFFLIFDYLLLVNWLYLFIYWVPINLQYSTFSLLVVYYRHLQHQHKAEWYALKRKYFAIWIVTNVIFIILALIWISLGIRYDAPGGEEPGWLNKIHSIFSGTIFFSLVMVLAWHTWKVLMLMRGTQTKLLAKVFWNKILIVALGLFLSFTSRTVYDFITALDPDLGVEVSGGGNAKLFTFIAFCIWEILPIILVLVLFGNVRSTTLGVFSKAESKKVTTYIRPKKITESQDALLKAQLFNDPRRYDSDDETTPLHKGSPLFGIYGGNSPYLTSSINNPPQEHVIVQTHGPNA